MRSSLLGAAAALVLTLLPAMGIAQALSSRPDHVLVYVLRRGWHIDIGFETADLKRPLLGLTAEFPAARALFFGFGDRRYLAAKNRSAPVLLAALWPGRSLLLATALEATPESIFGPEKLAALELTSSQALALQYFIWQSIDEPRSYAQGPYDGSRYFTARPKYSALHTCNTWAAEALRAGALPIRSRGTLLAGQLWRQVRRLQTQQSTAGPSTVVARPTH